MLTQHQVDKYVESQGLVCPRCGNTIMRTDTPEDINSNSIYCQIACENCEFSGTEFFTLTGIEENDG